MAEKPSSSTPQPAPKPHPPAMPQTVFISEKRGAEPAAPPAEKP